MDPRSKSIRSKVSFFDSTTKMIEKSQNHLLRILHYPPLNGNEQKGAIRGAAHEDINLITLLVAGTQPGLQVQDINGTWHDVSCDIGSIAINTGDMLSEASNGYFPSTTHRVINPNKQIKNKKPLFNAIIFTSTR